MRFRAGMARDSVLRVLSVRLLREYGDGSMDTARKAGVMEYAETAEYPAPAFGHGIYRRGKTMANILVRLEHDSE